MLIWTPAARQDLDDIWFYVAQRNEVAADRLLDKLVTRARRLLDYPELGPARDDVRTGFRHLVETPYLILYRMTQRGPEIVRVIDGRRDLSTL